MDILLIVVIFLISALLLVTELFLIPGFGFAGVGAAVGLVVADVMVFRAYGTAAGLCVLGISVLLVGLLLWFLMRSRTIDRLSLKQNIASTAATKEQLSVAVGEEGVALTRLALIGNALIGGKQVEVRSVDGFMDEGTPVVVCGVSQALILVKRKQITH